MTMICRILYSLVFVKDCFKNCILLKDIKKDIDRSDTKIGTEKTKGASYVMLWLDFY